MTYPHSKGVVVDSAFCSQTNSLLAEFVDQAPDRLRAFAKLDMTDVDSAITELQRSVQVYGYNMAGKSGAARGEVLYYYKCWFCHNDFARAAGSPAPGLKDIFKRTTMPPHV